MTTRCRSWLFVALPFLAALCIAVGPAPSAAAARLTDLVEKETQKRQHDDADGSGSGETSDSKNDENGMSGFVAPASAKPGETGSTTIVVGIAPPFERQVAPTTFTMCKFDDARDRVVVTHHRPHMPNAPPST